jgi:hypothetical protein
MDDHSSLDSKYFITADTYNCPFCNRRHVRYRNLGRQMFNWSTEKQCAVWRVECASCQKVSMHLTYIELQDSKYGQPKFKDDVDLDRAFFYSVPTSFFVVDKRIPRVIRELITEAEGCARMNYLVGASACTRKAIYEFLSSQGAEGQDYDEKIQNVQGRNPSVDPELFEILGHIKDMTSDHVHEQSWVAWDSKNVHMVLEALKAVLHEVYVVPEEKKNRADSVRALRAELGKKASSTSVPPARTRDKNNGA